MLPCTNSRSTNSRSQFAIQFAIRTTVFRLTPDRKRKGSHQRLPNLAVWATLLSPSVKAVILDLSEISAFDEHSINELPRISDRLKAQGRVLLVAGYRPRLEALAGTSPYFSTIEAAAGSMTRP